MNRLIRWGSRRLLAGGRGSAARAARGRRRRAITAFAVYLVALVLGGGQLLRVVFFAARAEWVQTGAAAILTVAMFGLAASIGVKLGMPPRAFLSWLFRRNPARDAGGSTDRSAD
jgi:hypothetical protein